MSSSTPSAETLKSTLDRLEREKGRVMEFEAVMEKGAIDKLKALSEKVNG